MIRFLFLIAFLSAFHLTSISQCAECTADVNCTSADGFPTICPETLPNGQAGEYYEQFLTFYLPADINDPSSGIQATLLQIDITSVTGLPFGTIYTLSHPDGIYYPADGDNLGCATICGTPLLPGTYNVLINVNALASAFGFEINQSESFTYTLIIDPGDVATASFTADNVAGCGNLNVYYEALISGSNSQQTTYDWNFGNGLVSDLPNPSTSYDAPGTYTVSLTTTIADYLLQEVNLSNISTNGEGDVDEFFSGPADPYFNLIDGSGASVFTSSVIDDTTSPSWTGLNIPLTTPPYTIEFWDDDTVTSDDALGTNAIAMSSGDQIINTGSGTVGTAVVVLSVATSITDQTDITIFGLPDNSISTSGNTISCTDPGSNTYVWYYNGVPIDGETNSSLAMTNGGNYTAVITNEFGCSIETEPYLFCPSITPIYDPVAMEIYVDDLYESYQWFYNGLELDGATTFYLVNPALGNYAVVVTTSYGCEIESEVLVLATDVAVHLAPADFNLYPNPASDRFLIQTQLGQDMQQIRIYDLQGRIVYSRDFTQQPIQNAIVDLSDWADGMYHVQVVTEKGQSAGNLVVRH
ncbi:MAG: T9SS type A sorting domain-containing protein [Flavobacteriales bacterium]